MAINGVPWAIAGGASIDVGVARMIPYFMFAGNEGVLNALDCEVKALAVPGGSIRVSPGGYNIIGRLPGQLYESYLNRITADEVVAVDPTAGAGRSDLVVLRILDSHVVGSPWANPASLANGPYADVNIVKNVPSTTTNVRQLGNSWSAITLARIDIPASTSTITQAMIKPLRTKVSPPAPPVPPPVIVIVDDDDSPDNPEVDFSRIVNGPNPAQPLTAASINVWRVWPAAATWSVPIPKWATNMDVICSIYNAEYDGSIWGETRIEIGNGELYTPATMYDLNYHGGPGPERDAIVAGAGNLQIPSAMRGKCKRFRLNARSLAVAPTHPGTIQCYRGALIRLEINFKERCE